MVLPFSAYYRVFRKGKNKAEWWIEAIGMNMALLVKEEVNRKHEHRKMMDIIIMSNIIMERKHKDYVG